MTRSHRIGRMLLAGTIAAAASTFVASPADAATPTCNTAAGYEAPAYVDVWAAVPAYRSGTNPPTTRCNLVRGTHGEAVEVLQRTINECFGFREKLREDGDFGSRTQALLKAAQQQVGTPDDGEYGPNTRDRFNARAKWHADRQSVPVCVQVTGLT